MGTQLQLTADERRAIEAARLARGTSRAAWADALPTCACPCGQVFYVEHLDQDVCRDCMGDAGFYPVPAWTGGGQ